jgi:hypothetical protein
VLFALHCLPAFRTHLIPGLGQAWANFIAAIFAPAREAGMELVHPVDWSLSPATVLTAAYIGRLNADFDPHCREAVPHILVCFRITHLQWYTKGTQYVKDRPYSCLTSLSLVFRKTR